MSAIERLWHLFDRYDREEQALLEHERREGVEAAWPHVEVEGRPE